ncbi:hypothetical protein DICVIV_11665 [Dictyocaulus viviparus]|uniref:G-protein coupled receptors family 1 profile domain-containing protein n=1 Tax=Dictyocaulus viviparus TaxID=29172 RepID=A0A0D8XF82_DICVI|nr:hypothetical protein DICVIV_11665 [Dictyocaulus viviparus]
MPALKDITDGGFIRFTVFDCNGLKCFMNKEKIFTIVTWAGHLNSMLNPLIYSRFSRDFRRAFKQILTCQREQKTKMAFKTPLSLLLAKPIAYDEHFLNGKSNGYEDDAYYLLRLVLHIMEHQQSEIKRSNLPLKSL